MDLVEVNKKKEKGPQTCFLSQEKKETHCNSLCNITVPPPRPPPISNPPKTYTLSTCKQLLMWCWDPQSREPGSGSFSRGYLKHTKGVLFVAPPPVGPLPVSILYVGLTVSWWWWMMTPCYSEVFTETRERPSRLSNVPSGGTYMFVLISLLN